MTTYTFHAYLTSPATKPPSNSAEFLSHLHLSPTRAEFMETPEDKPIWLYLGPVEITADFSRAQLDSALRWSLQQLDERRAEILAKQYEQLQRIDELRANLLALPAPKEV